MGVIPIGRPKQPRAKPQAVAPGLASPASPFSGMFKTADGAQLYYEDTGGTGPVLFFVYGLGCSHLHWKYPRAYFAEDGGTEQVHRQIWIDFRGHGRSDPPPLGHPLTLKSIVADIRALCAHRGVERATFLGQSMGGPLVIELAHQYPDLVQGLVLLASPGRDPGQHLPLAPVSQWLGRGMIGLNKAAPAALRAAYTAMKPSNGAARIPFLMREMIRWYGFNPGLARTEDIDEYIGKIFEISPTHFYDLAADLASFDVARIDPPVVCPALVIAGARDHVVPLAESYRLAKNLPRSELFVVQHGSHCPHFDDPGLVCRRMERFLNAHGL